ncbi:hypothetical protein [Rahnella woolbedingensis]|uniref:Uncharacterized protein n=1 Tax=Rahnella woolbedingensis TaxID=1510574 RepID=A0A419NCG0_9GAMM|nr:hypothetical protein [Rahnella woolbedingensis]RJT45830.1 hypothetical protein D6C13_06860 [Rahnella woolbedingensis]
MTRNTTQRRRSFAARLTHIMQIQTQYGRLWLNSRFRRVKVPVSLKVTGFAVLTLMVLAITGTMLLMLDLFSLISGLLKRPFRRGNIYRRQLMRKPV